MLSSRQIENFFKDGYLVVENVFDEEAFLNPIREEYAVLLDQLIEMWVKRGEIAPPCSGADFFEKLNHCYRLGCDWFQPMDISLPADRITKDTPMHFGPAVFNLVTAPVLLDIVEQLIGPEITSNPIQHVRLKPPAKKLKPEEIRAHITSTDWHQDRGVAHDEADETDMVTVWCAITDATVENGCLQVVPKGEIVGLLPHCPKSQTALADGVVDTSKAIPLPVKAGGIVLFHPLTPHASLENHTEHFRWSFDLRFNKTGQPTGRSHFPDFVARSLSQPEKELRDWKEWRSLWEDARTALCEEPHIDIHRWQSDAPACA